MDELPLDIRYHVQSFRVDWEAITRRQLNRLNKAVRRRAIVRRFRPLSMGALLSRAMRLYEEDEILFPHLMNNFLTRWMINNGLDWPGHRYYSASFRLIAALENWLDENPPGIVEYPVADNWDDDEMYI